MHPFLRTQDCSPGAGGKVRDHAVDGILQARWGDAAALRVRGGDGRPSGWEQYNICISICPKAGAGTTQWRLESMVVMAVQHDGSGMKNAWVKTLIQIQNQKREQ